MKYLFTLFVLFGSFHSSYCQIGMSLVLNGCTDYLEIAETDLLDYDDAISIECWIAPNCDDGNRIIVGKEWCVGEMSYYLSAFAGKLFWRFSESGSCVSETSSFQSVNNVIPSGEFTHVAVVHGQSEVSLFVNGTEVAGEYIQGSFNPIHNSNQEFRIGVYKNIGGSFGNYFSGLIDEVRVWSIALTESLIQSNMNTTLTGNEGGLILYLDMESTAFSSSLQFENKANISENLVANTAGFTSLTPYCIDPLTYEENPINFLDYYAVCDDILVLILGDNEYKNIMWSTGSTSNSTSISESGFYSITIETELCKTFSHTFEVDILESVFEQISVAICKDDFYVYNGDELPPNSSTTYLIEGTSGCDTTLVINVLEIQQLESDFLGEDINSCIDFVELLSPYENTIWNDDFIGPSFTVDTEGIYYAVATDELGCSYIDSIFVSFEVIFEQISVAICKDDLYPFNGELLSPNTSTTHILEGADGCDSTVLIHVLEVPHLESDFLGEDIVSCITNVELLSPYENTIWNDDFIGPSFTVVTEGVYYAVATDELGCSYSDTISISFEVIFEQITVAICKDDLYSFNGELLSPNTSTTHTLEGADGCDSTVLIHVLEVPQLESDFLGDDIVSCITNVELFSPYANTVWNDDFVGPSFTVVTEGVFYAVATDELGCSYSDTISISFEVIFEEITVAICKDDFYPFNGELLSPNTSTTHILEGTDGCDSTVLINVVEIPQVESSFLGTDFVSCKNPVTLESPFENTLWNNDSIDSLFIVDEEGTYFAIATDELGCSFSDSITILFESIAYDTTVTICQGELYDYYGDLLAPNSSTPYLIETNQGCDTTLTINVIEEASEKLFENTIISTCQNEIVLSSPFDSTLWNNQFVGREFVVETEGIYVAEAINNLGCIIKDSIQIEFLSSNFYLPNVISINSQINNCFKPVFSKPNTYNYTLTIYDRWGNKKFSETGNDISWCGYCDNKPVVLGVYVFVLEIENTCESKTQKVGTLTVI